MIRDFSIFILLLIMEVAVHGEDRVCAALKIFDGVCKKRKGWISLKNFLMSVIHSGTSFMSWYLYSQFSPWGMLDEHCSCNQVII